MSASDHENDDDADYPPFSADEEAFYKKACFLGVIKGPMKLVSAEEKNDDDDEMPSLEYVDPEMEEDN